MRNLQKLPLISYSNGNDQVDSYVCYSPFSWIFHGFHFLDIKYVYIDKYNI